MLFCDTIFLIMAIYNNIFTIIEQNLKVCLVLMCGLSYEISQINQIYIFYHNLIVTVVSRIILENRICCSLICDYHLTHPKLELLINSVCSLSSF